MEPRQELIDGEAGGKHIDADDGRALRLDAGNVAVFDLLVVGSGVVAPKAGGGDIAHCEKTAAHQA